MRRAFSSTEITWLAAMATARMGSSLLRCGGLRRGGRLAAVDPPALR
jgi:hypothetical protein